MSRYVYGERVAKTAQIKVGASAVIYDESGEKVLLTRRSDNGRWCLPSGGMDAGESIVETCVREVREETGLEVRVTRLVGIYSTPHRISTYKDGNRWQVVGVSFEAEITGGALGLSDETTEIGFFSWAEMAELDLLEPHRERIADALKQQTAAFIE